MSDTLRYIGAMVAVIGIGAAIALPLWGIADCLLEMLRECVMRRWRKP